MQDFGRDLLIVLWRCAAGCAGTGLIYLTCWPLYDDLPSSRYVCASVPALATLHFFSVGCGFVNDPLVVAGSTVSVLTSYQFSSYVVLSAISAAPYLSCHLDIYQVIRCKHTRSIGSQVSRYQALEIKVGAEDRRS